MTKAEMVHLPKSFLGFLPLYIGVELGLGISIFNKFSGFYGILALFTGHPLDFMQWCFYLLSVLTLLVYLSGLWQIRKPNPLTYSLVLVVFTIDTLLNCFFTIWFSAQWFSIEENDDNKGEVGTSKLQSAGRALGPAKELNRRDNSLASQSASQGYEYTMTMLFTVLTLAVRFYFNFILAAFVQQMLRHPKYIVDKDDVEQDLKNKSLFRRLCIKSEKWCYNACQRALA